MARMSLALKRKGKSPSGMWIYSEGFDERRHGHVTGVAKSEPTRREEVCLTAPYTGSSRSSRRRRLS